MRAGVTVGGVVAAADVAALEADPQVQPDAALAQAVLTAVDGSGQLGDRDRPEVSAGAAHWR
jgi:hypothetical protein